MCMRKLICVEWAFMFVWCFTKKLSRLINVTFTKLTWEVEGEKDKKKGILFVHETS